MIETTTISRRAIPLWVQILVWVFLVGLLALLGLGTKRANHGSVQPGEKIPDFNLTLYSRYEYNGRSDVKISDLHGKVIFINFWASWCKPCEEEAAVLEEAWK